MADATQYKATVAWRTLAGKVVQLTKATESILATYRVYVSPSDRHDVGAGTVQTGFYFISYLGNPYLIIATGLGYIDVEDSFRFRKCPTSGKNGIVYKSVGDGDSPYLAPFFRFLHPNAFEKFMGIALDILWREKIGADEKVKYNSSDVSAGYLSEKIIAGTNITIEEGIGADENKLKISSTGGGSTTYLGLTDTSDTTYTGKDKYVPIVDEANSELDLTPTVLATLLKLDGPTSYVGAGGYSVKIKQTLDGFEFLPDGMNQISPSISVGIPDNYSKIVADELVLTATVDLTIVGSGSLTII